MIDQRPTPADPLPGVSVDRSIPGPKRTLPPELGPDAIAVLEGRTFMYSDSVGDVPKGSIGGLVHADTRFLSRWALTINGAPFLVLRAGTVDYYSAEFFLTNPRLEGLEANSVGLRRLRFVGDGLHERLELESYRRRAAPDRASAGGRQRLRRPVRDQGPGPRPLGRRSSGRRRTTGPA